MPYRSLKDCDKELLTSIKHENIVKILAIVSSFLCVPVNYNWQETDEYKDNAYIVLELCLTSIDKVSDYSNIKIKKPIIFIVYWESGASKGWICKTNTW